MGGRCGVRSPREPVACAGCGGSADVLGRVGRVKHTIAQGVHDKLSCASQFPSVDTASHTAQRGRRWDTLWGGGCGGAISHSCAGFHLLTPGPQCPGPSAPPLCTLPCTPPCTLPTPPLCTPLCTPPCTPSLYPLHTPPYTPLCILSLHPLPVPPAPSPCTPPCILSLHPLHPLRALPPCTPLCTPSLHPLPSPVS